MKRIFILAMLAFSSLAGNAQVCTDFAVQLQAAVQSSPARITLSWKSMGDTTTYTIYRKPKHILSWGGARATLTTRDSSWVDSNVVVDSAYEYRVSATRRNGANIWPSEGYIYAGIKAPAIHNRGGLILMVDSTFSDSCSAGIHQLMKDLSGDGWQVIRHDVPRTLADTGVKRLIANDYSSIPGIKALFLLGHVAVPYSGDQNPDGHSDHKGAWPTDHYYTYLSATWTDATVTDTSSGYAANRNVPGDGKWDAIGYTSRSELQVGRVDVYNMPAFSATEVQMMKRYLARDHAFKMDSIAIRRRALVDDNFGVFTITTSGPTYYEAFASSGWRNFAPIVSRDSIATTDYINSLDSGSYLWAYGCGGGWFQGAGGIGATSDFATHNVNGIFSMLFGSYFGDWNVQDNFLRAPLCSAVPALTNCWSGRPYWFFHQMALGDHIGYCAWQSQNNSGNVYGPFSFAYQNVTAGFMGDPSLRHDYVQPITNLNVTAYGTRGANLSWTASPDATVLGYYIYRCDSNEFGAYQRVSNLVTTTSFRDSVGVSGAKFYMVRPVKLESTPSGGYYNLGIGVTDSATIIFPTAVSTTVMPVADLKVYPNPTSRTVDISIKATSTGSAIIRIVNMEGKIVLTLTKQLMAGYNSISVDLGTLAAGTYFLSLDKDGSSTTTTVVKQ